MTRALVIVGKNLRSVVVNKCQEYFRKNYHLKQLVTIGFSRREKNGKYPEHSVRGGKWLIFISNHNVDRIWVKIRKAVEEGKLGGTAKVATAKVNLDFPGSKKSHLCLYL